MGGRQHRRHSSTLTKEKNMLASVTQPRQQDSFLFGGVPPDLTRPWLHAWITDPPGMVNRLLDPQATAEHVLSITRDVDQLMKQRWPEASKYLYVHDFSHVKGYDTAARKILQEWGVASRPIIGLIVVVVPDSNKILQMGAHAGTAFLRALGIPMEVSYSVHDTLLKYSIGHAV